MKTIPHHPVLLLLVALSVLLTSCGKQDERAADTPDSLLEELIVQMDAFMDTMHSAKDKESAEKAVGALNSIVTEITAIADRMKNLPESGEAEKKRLAKKWEDHEKKAMKEKDPNSSGIMNRLEVAPILGKAMQSFGKRLNVADKTFQKFGIRLVKTK